MCVCVYKTYTHTHKNILLSYITYSYEWIFIKTKSSSFYQYQYFILVYISFKYLGQWQTLSGYRDHKKETANLHITCKKGGNTNGQYLAQWILFPLHWHRGDELAITTMSSTVSCQLFRGRIFRSESFYQLTTSGSFTT